MASPSRDDMHVLIVGAGITGLLLAQGLKQASIPFTIFEAESAIANRTATEWSIGVHWCLPRLESLMGSLWPRLREAKNHPFYPEKATDVMSVFNAATGEKMKDVPLARVVRVSRRKMRALCAEGLHVQYKKKLVAVEFCEDGTEVALNFFDGSRATGTLVVGADGPHSKVRENLFRDGSENATPLPVAMLRTNVCYHDADKIRYILDNTHPVFCVGYDPSNAVLFNTVAEVSDPDRPEDWVMQLTCSWLDRDQRKDLTSEDRLKLVKERFSGLPSAFGKAWEWVPEGTYVSFAALSYWATKEWDNKGGRVTLAGDAAHPLPPYRGQGLNNCVEDVWNLVEELKMVKAGEKTVEGALGVYDKELVERGKKEVEREVENAYAVHNWETVTESAQYRKGWAKPES